MHGDLLEGNDMIIPDMGGKVKRGEGKQKKERRIRLLLIRMFNTTFVGTGVLDCPQQKNFGRELVFSADLCYNGITS